MAAYVGDTVEPNREPRNLRTEQGSQPSVSLSPTHEGDSAERTRRLEMRERIQACVIYSRGEIPSEIFDKIDRTVELLGPSQNSTGFEIVFQSNSSSLARA